MLSSNIFDSAGIGGKAYHSSLPFSNYRKRVMIEVKLLSAEKVKNLIGGSAAARNKRRILL